MSAETHSTPLSDDRGELRAQAYVRAVTRLRRERRQAALRNVERLRWLVLQMEAVENEASALARGFNDPARWRRRPFKFVWAYPDPARRLGPVGPVLVRQDTKSGVYRRAAARLKDIDRATHPEQRSGNEIFLRRMRALTNVRDRYAKVLEPVMKHLFTLAHQYGITAGFTRATNFQGARHRRRQALEVAIATYWDLLDRIEASDVKLDEKLVAFNSIGPKRTGSVIARWRVENTKSNRVKGPAGPYFYQIRLTGGSRALYRLATKGRGVAAGKSVNRVTRQLLKKNFLSKWVGQIHPVAVQIERDRIAYIEHVEHLLQIDKSLRRVALDAPLGADNE